MNLKEPLSGSLHFLGMLLSIAALVVLVVVGRDSAWKVVSFSIYGATLILLYNFSTLYHWLPREAGGRFQLFRKLDHLSIYLLIAGTYTPFCLVTLRGPWGWSLFGVVWGLAVLGVLVQSIYINVNRWITTAIYLGMGWMVLIAIKPLIDTLPAGGIILLAAGGVLYSVGGAVHAAKKPNLFKYYGFHELWHTLVLLGSTAHFFSILLYVAR
ncbi:MAG TPA: hemolysin III family protein [Candidatus Omnitrophota bacterium]|nr:hemolysin III family protein [Candidatus Omnitrophota bacterium]